MYMCIVLQVSAFCNKVILFLNVYFIVNIIIVGARQL